MKRALLSPSICKARFSVAEEKTLFQEHHMLPRVARLQVRVGADNRVLDVAAVLHQNVVHEHAVDNPA